MEHKIPRVVKRKLTVMHQLEHKHRKEVKRVARVLTGYCLRNAPWLWRSEEPGDRAAAGTSRKQEDGGSVPGFL